MGDLTAITSTANSMTSALSQFESQVDISKNGLLTFLTNQGATCSSDLHCQAVLDATNALNVPTVDLSSVSLALI